jgi:hypothetical protein
MNPWSRKGSRKVQPQKLPGSGKDGAMLEKDYYRELREFMMARGWMVRKITVMHDSMTGWPDVFASHPVHGQRFIETKRPKTGRLTEDQFRVFIDFQTHGVGIWILETMHDYPKLFEKPNWHLYTFKEFRP